MRLWNQTLVASAYSDSRGVFLAGDAFTRHPTGGSRDEHRRRRCDRTFMGSWRERSPAGETDFALILWSGASPWPPQPSMFRRGQRAESTRAGGMRPETTVTTRGEANRIEVARRRPLASDSAKMIGTERGYSYGLTLNMPPTMSRRAPLGR